MEKPWVPVRIFPSTDLRSTQRLQQNRPLYEATLHMAERVGKWWKFTWKTHVFPDICRKLLEKPFLIIWQIMKIDIWETSLEHFGLGN